MHLQVAPARLVLLYRCESCCCCYYALDQPDAPVLGECYRFCCAVHPHDGVVCCAPTWCSCCTNHPHGVVVPLSAYITPLSALTTAALCTFFVLLLSPVPAGCSCTARLLALLWCNATSRCCGCASHNYGAALSLCIRSCLYYDVLLVCCVPS